MRFKELMVSWEEGTWTLVRILGKRPRILPLLPLHTQPSGQGGSWHSPSDWAQTVLQMSSWPGGDSRATEFMPCPNRSATDHCSLRHICLERDCSSQ